MRVTADGKFFALGGSRFHFRGASIHALGSAACDRDFDDIRAAGFTVISGGEWDSRAVEAAASRGLYVVVCQDAHDWDPLIGTSRFERRRITRAMANRLRRQVRQLGGSDAVLGVALGDRLDPAVRCQLGHRSWRGVVAQVAADLHDDDPDLLVSWTAAWPSDVGCPPGIDYLTVALSLSDREELTAALSTCHRQVGDQPLVVGAIELAGSCQDFAGWVIASALERGAAGTLACSWPLTVRGPGAPDPTGLNQRTVRDLRDDWPKVSVVICAYNAASTLAECLSHCDALDYPELELIVVDDGSTDTTRTIAESYPGIRMVSVPHMGLSAARNAGFQAASGALIAYLDADAYPSPEWPWYLALGAAGPGVAGSGGPNVPPVHDPVGAQITARTPGGPIPQLAGEDRAIHIPGCNMAFWKDVLARLNGFDPTLSSAEDVEFCLRVLDSGLELGYHPAALIWHHRRPGLRPYLRQQRSYGRGQAQTDRRYPDRYPRFRRIRKLKGALAPPPGAPGGSGSYRVVYRSLHWRDRPVLDLAHQWGVPLAAALACTAPVGLVMPPLALPGIAALAYLTVMFGLDVALAGSSTTLPGGTLRPRLLVACGQLARPVAFRWGKWREGAALRWKRPTWPPAPRQLGGLSPSGPSGVVARAAPEQLPPPRPWADR